MSTLTLIANHRKPDDLWLAWLRAITAWQIACLHACAAGLKEMACSLDELRL